MGNRDRRLRLGVFEGNYAVMGGVDKVVLSIRGCPPTPTVLLEGLIALLDRGICWSVRSGGVMFAFVSAPHHGRRSVMGASLSRIGT